MLEVKDLVVRLKDGGEILKGVSFEVGKGESVILMGPNGSGKSTLAGVLMGNPKYEVVSGKIFFNGEDLLKMSTDERARKGLFLSFQNPNEISGVTISNFLRTALNSRLSDGEKVSPIEFHKLLTDKLESLGMKRDFLKRYLNEGFSGGEKKRSEILQLLVLNPLLAILDEPDSGLDIDALKFVASGVREFMKESGKSVLLITHYKRILEHLDVDRVLIMQDGKIVREGGRDLVEKLEGEGYGWLSEED